jgi:hypothetical protein
MSVDRLKKLAECERMIFDVLGDDLGLLVPLTRRLVVTFNLKVEEVFPDTHFVGNVGAPKGALGQVVAPATPSGSAPDPIGIEVKVEAANAAPAESKESGVDASMRNLGDLVKDLEGLAPLLLKRSTKVTKSTGSYKTHLTKLKTVTSDLDATISVILKSRSSSEISENLLANYNNTLVSFCFQAQRILTLDHQALPSAASRLIKSFLSNGKKLCKVWSLARNLPSNKWKYNDDLGNVTEIILEEDVDAGGKKEDEW